MNNHEFLDLLVVEMLKGGFFSPIAITICTLILGIIFYTLVLLYCKRSNMREIIEARVKAIQHTARICRLFPLRKS